MKLIRLGQVLSDLASTDSNWDNMTHIMEKPLKFRRILQVFTDHRESITRISPEFVRPKKLRIEENDMQDPSRVYFFAVLFIFERI